MNNSNRTLAVLAAAALAGCASPGENVLFVTKTSLGIDLDGAPPTASIAYDRVEGYLGPRFDNGTVPPVVAKISTNGGLIARDVKQYYATGNAAIRLTRDGEPETPIQDLQGEAQPMFFGTSTTLGIKIGFTTTVPDSFVLGYRRKEASLIPIATRIEAGANGESVKKHAYPSVIGVFSNDVRAGTPTDTTLGLTQFFATGAAAEALAGKQELRNEFQGFAIDAVDAYKDATRSQQRLLLSLMYCFTKLEDTKFDAVLTNVDQLGLIPNAPAIKAASATNMRAARADYVKAISVPNVDPPERTGKLEGHTVYVCELASLKKEEKP